MLMDGHAVTRLAPRTRAARGQRRLLYPAAERLIAEGMQRAFWARPARA